MFTTIILTVDLSILNVLIILILLIIIIITIINANPIIIIIQAKWCW